MISSNECPVPQSISASLLHSNEHEPVRQEGAYSRAKKMKKRNTPLGKALIFNAQEPGEPTVYEVDLTDAPSHMQRRIRMNFRNAGKTVYNHLYAEPDGLNGLVDSDAEEVDERAEEIMAYFESKCIPQFEFKPPCCEPIQYVFTLAHV